MGYTDHAAMFGCADDTLFGILSVPECAHDTAVVVVVGGPQYRAGSHRQFVLLARALATTGYAVLRFDCRGMGDSGGDQRDFEQVSLDIAAAVDLVMARVPGLRRVVLWGLCDGASAALLYCHETHDPRVAGLCLLNPWVRSETSLARTHVKHYYTQRLMQRDFWAKLLRGDVAASALGGLLGSLRAARARPRDSGAALSYTQRMAAGWRNPDHSVLLLLSGDDYTAKEFTDHLHRDAACADAMQHPRLQRHELPQADHTCSSSNDQRCVEQLTLGWLAQLQPAPQRHLAGHLAENIAT